LIAFDYFSFAAVLYSVEHTPYTL